MYETSNGTISSFGGFSGGAFATAGPGELVLPIGTGSYSNQTLIHSMFCYVNQGHSGGFPFHVDLSTKEVVWG
ncbi:MAG: hypothetical protein ACHQ2Y_01975 [Candidatus Lutacidiplasmatales archaeon]